MIKVPFDWEVFQKNNVVIEFVVDEHVDIFAANHFTEGVPYKDGSTRESLRWCVYDDVSCWRFRKGVWHSFGYRHTYDDSAYDDYLHMVYDPDLDMSSGCVEVGDLL